MSRSANNPSVAIIVLNWKGSEDTLACLESLSGLNYANFGVFICDNASPDDSMEKFQAWESERLGAVNEQRLAAGKTAWQWRDLSPLPNLGSQGTNLASGGPGIVTLIQTGTNLGYAGGNNVGMRRAMAEGYDYCWILNNDTEVDADALGAMVSRMREDGRIGICGSTLIYHAKRDMVQHLGGSRFNVLKGRGEAIGFGADPVGRIDRQAVEGALDFISGASMLVSRAFLKDVGEMEESYFLYGEEMDWSFRARGRFTLGYAPGSLVFHKVGASIGTNDFGDRSPLSDYHLARSRLKLCWKYSKVSLPFVCFDIGRDAARWLLRRRPERAMLLVRAAIGLPMAQKVRQARGREENLAAVHELLMNTRLVASEHDEDALVNELIQPRHPMTLAFINQHSLNLAFGSDAFRAGLLASDVLVRDGVGAEAALLLLGRQPGRNINGTDFIPTLLKAAAEQGSSVLLLGTVEPWLGGAVARVAEMGVRVVGSLDGFQAAEEYLAIVAAADPDVIVLGMGMPRQEEVAELLVQSSSRPRLIINGGAILDFYAGRFPRAPRWLRLARLEWAWRLLNEPRRLAPRYLAGGITFLGLLARLLLLRMIGGPASARSASRS